MSLRHAICGRQGILVVVALFLLSSVVLAQDDQPTPKFDIFGGYAWLHPGGSVGLLHLNDIPQGFGLTGTYNVNKNFGLSLDFGDHLGSNSDMQTVMIGPRFLYRVAQFQPFAHAMIGLNRLTPQGLPSDNGVGAMVGGGFDIPVLTHLAIRLFEADYMWSHHNFRPLVPDTTNLSGAQLRAGLELRLATGPPPTPMSASCSVQPNEVFPGEPVTATATVNDIPKKHTVTYAWNGTGGKVTGKDNTASIDTTGVNPGSYNVTATATDTKPHKNEAPATCTASYTVKERPRHPPTIACSAAPTTVRSGEPSTITCTGQSPDDRPLTYSFTSTGGRLTPSGARATLDTAGAAAGPITVTGTTTDDRGLSANSTASVNVEVPPPPPQASKLNEIQFKDARRPARVDNEAKAILDDVALRLQREPDSKLVIVGNPGAIAMPRGRRAPRGLPTGDTLAQQRAVNTKTYLTQEKGIDPSRIEVRTGSTDAPSTELYLVPSGATFNVGGTQTFDENQVKPAAQPRRRRTR